jgi:UDP-N-acetylglucosamine 2-epimerase (non-hydrolysing)
MKKVMLVFGTRPEAIKMAPLSHAFKAEDGLETLVCVTAQHREMLDQVLSIFDLIPDIDLNLMIDNQDLFNLTASIITKMRDVLATHKPDIVLVHGDTTTTMATSIACFYAGISVGHVEAGLRTHNNKAPFPEEFNRRVASLVKKIQFAPTTLSRQNLINENIDVSKIFITGNTVIDSLHWVLNKIEFNPSEISRLKKILDDVLPFNWLKTRYVLITGHRRENLGAGFIVIC